MHTYAFLTFKSCGATPAQQTFHLANDSEAFALSIVVAREHAPYSYVLILRDQRPFAVRRASRGRAQGRLVLFIEI